MQQPQHHPRRKPARLKGFDYTRAGYCFITVCAWQRRCTFGHIAHGSMHANAIGAIVLQQWQAIPSHFPAARLDEFVLMPNHFHGILILCDGAVGARHAVPVQGGGEKFGAPVAGSLATIIRSFKAATARGVRLCNDTATGQAVGPLWHRGYWDHVIRSETALAGIRRYIRENPLKWELDRLNPCQLRNGQR